MSLSSRCVFAVILGASTLTAMPAWGQEPVKTEGRKVVANATVTTYAAPDAARLTFVVTTTEAAGKSGREANDKQVKALRDALAALPLNKETIEVQVLPSSVTTLVSPQPNMIGVRPVQGKRVQSVFCVTVREKDPQKLREAVARVAEAAVDNGATSPDAESMRPVLRLPRRIPGGDEEPDAVPGPTIEWLATASKESRREAIRRAVSDAKADAQAAVGDEKLRVLTIDVSGPDDAPVRFRLRSESGIPDSGLIPLKIRVQITFAY